MIKRLALGGAAVFAIATTPAALAGGIYDPSAILNPDKGVPKVLTSVTNPTITGTDGEAWTVSGTVPAAVRRPGRWDGSWAGGGSSSAWLAVERRVPRDRPQSRRAAGR